MKETIQNDATLTDIVFEHRNKAYGAYQLRKNYGRNVNKAVIIGVSLFLIALISPMLFAKIKPKEEALRAVTLEVTDLPPDKIEKPIEPPKEQHKEIEPIKTEKFVDIEVIDDTKNVIETPPPTQDELKNAAIGNMKIDGKDANVDFVVVPTIVEKRVEVPAEVEDNSVKDFIAIEIQPEFMGGMTEMYKFLGKNIAYPNAAQRANVQGKVFVSFVIEKDGSISNLTTLKGVGFGCDEEAMRVVKMMPKWKPGRQQGNPVRVKYVLPVVFRLAD